jgi:hypothetical protein
MRQKLNRFDVRGNFAAVGGVGIDQRCRLASDF